MPVRSPVEGGGLVQRRAHGDGEVFTPVESACFTWNRQTAQSDVTALRLAPGPGGRQPGGANASQRWNGGRTVAVGSGLNAAGYSTGLNTSPLSSFG